MLVWGLHVFCWLEGSTSHTFSLNSRIVTKGGGAFNYIANAPGIDVGE